MNITKGSYVHCKRLDRAGVISELPSDINYVYVRWFDNWNGLEVEYYLELVCVDDIQDLYEKDMHIGLIALRRKTMR